MVLVLTGKSKDKRGTNGKYPSPHKVLKILVSEERAIVEGVNIVSKSIRPTAKNPQGGFVKQEAPIHVSNLSLVDPKSGEPTRVAIRETENGEKIRVAKKSGEEKNIIALELKKQFNYTSVMQVPILKKIVINQGLGDATQDKKIIDVAINEISSIAGQKAVATFSKKDIANFKLRKKMPIGVMVTLRREKMYEFLERLIKVSLPRIRDFKGITSRFDGKGNYTLGISEQIIFPEINIDQVDRIQGLNITFVTSAKTDEEGFALLKAFGLPFRKNKKD